MSNKVKKFKKGKIPRALVLVTVLLVAIFLSLSSVNFQNKKDSRQSANDDSNSSTQTGTGTNNGSGTVQGPKVADVSVKPAAETYSKNQVFEVEVRVNTGGLSINAIQADLTYPTDLLQFVSIDASGSALNIKAEESGGDGLVKIARGSLTEVKGDDVLIAKVKFKTLGKSGKAEVKLADSSAIVDSSQSSNILNNGYGAVITVVE